MNEQERGREYLADLLGESVPRATWPDESRGPRPDVVLVSDHATGTAFDIGPEHWQWWKSLRAAEPAVRPVPVDLLPGRDQIRYAEAVVEAMRARFGPWWPAEPPMTVGRAVTVQPVDDRRAGRQAMLGRLRAQVEGQLWR